MQLGIIKKRLIRNKNILKITKSLEVMCMTRLKVLHEKKRILATNRAKITAIVNEKLHGKSALGNMEKAQKIKVINILFFTDMSFCGTINKKNQNLAVSKLENLWIVGNKGRKVNGYYIAKLYHKNLCGLITEKIIETVSDVDLGEVNVFLGDNSFKIYYEKFSDMVEQEYFKCYFFYSLSRYILDFQNEECRIRLMKVSAAINNSEELDETLKNLYNKIRQQMITSELLELLTSGSGGNN